MTPEAPPLPPNTNDSAPPPVPPPPAAAACANCGAIFLGDWCHSCGQRRRDSRRLDVSEAVARFGEHLLDLDSAFLRTLVGLTRRPGVVCRDYVEGKRKRYMNPFGYFVLAGSAGLVLSTIVTRIFGDPMPADPETDAAASYVTWLLLATLVPLTLATWRLFRRAGRNLAENYVFALYTLGHYLWIELLILLPLSYALPEWATWTVYGVTWFGYLTFAAVPFYGERWWVTAAKVLAAGVALVLVIMVVTVIVACAGLIGDGTPVADGA